MNAEELEKILHLHKGWLKDKTWGKRANLQCADLQGANLQCADLERANLRGADLQGADLEGADLQGADLRGAKNIFSFGPVGEELRLGYAIYHGEKIMFQLGCFWGDYLDAVKAVRIKYGENSTYEKCLDLAFEVLRCRNEKWTEDRQADVYRFKA